MKRGVLLTTYDYESERVTYALARGITRWNARLPVGV